MLDFIQLHRHDDLYTTNFQVPLYYDEEDTPHTVNQAVFTSNFPCFHRAFLAFLERKLEKNTTTDVGIFSLDVVQLWMSEYTQLVLTLLHLYPFKGVYFQLDTSILDEHLNDVEADIIFDTREKPECREYTYFLDKLYETMLVEGDKRGNLDVVWSVLCDESTKENLEKLQKGEITGEMFEEMLGETDV